MSQLDSALTPALTDYLLALADDQLILAHRNSEWIGHAPILEEDIAIANIAQDELGHASLLYNLHGALTGDPPDHLVFFRDAAEFRSAQLLELPKGDWAVTILRQYLFDVYEQVLLDPLSRSAHAPLAAAATKMRNEELYHQRHTSSWVRRLGLGTEESHRRLQAALDQLWPYTAQLFYPLPDEQRLVEAHIAPHTAALRAAWEAEVFPQLQEAALTIPIEAATPRTAPRTAHTPHLTHLLADLQKVARFDPTATW